MKGIMIQGTASDVGKSFIATAFCAIFHKLGYKVAPFKSQNMSNNSYVTLDGREIGRAQGIQAEAAGTAASVYMNPILLKPKSDCTSEIVLLGKSYETLGGQAYREKFYLKGLEAIQLSLEKLSEQYDFLVMEGAGSPVEINLKDRELVNMKVAELADVPVILVADIDRGGVFASIIGTLELFSEEERSRVKGIIINKFRGDLSLFQPGVQWLEERTGIKVLGVVPYVSGHMIEGEDSLSLAKRFANQNRSEIDIAVVKLPYISNYTDVEPFLFEEDVSIRLVSGPDEFGEPDALVIPGTRSTIHDLQQLKNSGLAQKIKAYNQTGGTIIGICGGYQMLSRYLYDKAGSDTGVKGRYEEGFNILPVGTTFYYEKKTVRNKGIIHPQSGFPQFFVEGYEIHLGVTEPIVPQAVRPFIKLSDGTDGAVIDSGRVIGTYFHHIFFNDEFRTEWLNRIRERKGLEKKQVKWLKKEKTKKYEQIARHVQNHIHMDDLLNIIQSWGK